MLAAHAHVAVARDMVLALKYRGARHLAAPLAGLIAPLAECETEAATIVPVPLHPVRRAERGFNQSQLIAEKVADLTGHALRLDLLSRTRPTPSQQGLNPTERRENVAGAFRASGPAPTEVLLVDDVCTTGATLAACARALRRAGARRIVGLVVTRANVL